VRAVGHSTSSNSTFSKVLLTACFVLPLLVCPPNSFGQNSRDSEVLFRCDSYAVSPRDPSRLTDGVKVYAIDHENALMYCKDPEIKNNSKININLYRIYKKIKKSNIADYYLQQAVKGEHPYSYLVIAEKYLNEEGGLTHWFRSNKHFLSMVY